MTSKDIKNELLRLAQRYAQAAAEAELAAQGLEEGAARKEGDLEWSWNQLEDYVSDLEFVAVDMCDECDICDTCDAMSDHKCYILQAKEWKEWAEEYRDIARRGARVAKDLNLVKISKALENDLYLVDALTGL